MSMFRVLALLAAALCLGAARAATIDVFVFNNQFSMNPPGQPIRHPIITQGDTVRWVWVQGNHTTTSVAGSMEVWNSPINVQPDDAGLYLAEIVSICGNVASTPAALTVIDCACNPADIAGTDASPGPDGLVNNGDFSLFIASFFAGCP